MVVTGNDRKKAARIIRRLLSPDRLYEKYLSQAESFIDHFDRARDAIPLEKRTIYRLDFLVSKYFKRRYLVAFVDRKWLVQIAPECDAIASTSLIHLGFASPPLVLVPGRSVPRRRGFSSIMEHEFVHVNQGIVDEFPGLDSCKMDDGPLFRELMKHTQAEYEAHFVQLVHDPTLTPPREYGISLEEWCHLRAFTNGLEIVINRMLRESHPQAKAMRFFRKIQSDLPAEFGKRGLSKAIGRSFASDFDRMLDIAFFNVTHQARG